MENSAQESSLLRRLGIAAAAFLILAVAFARIDARESDLIPIGVHLDEGKTDRSELVALVHGFRGDIASLDGVRSAIRAERPNADIVSFRFPA